MFRPLVWCCGQHCLAGCDAPDCYRREMLLEFYAASGDFTRRLTSVKANSKFSSPQAGPDDLYSVCPSSALSGFSFSSLYNKACTRGRSTD